jgi:hypothetical protein
VSAPKAGGAWRFKNILNFGSKVGSQPQGSLVRIGKFF